MDDRPIHPNKQYLEQKEEQYKKKKQTQQYLKRQQLGEKILPCFKKNVQKQKINQKQITKSTKSKAEIYQQIKKKNREKFGEFIKIEPKKQEEKKKTIHPSKMTVNKYKQKEHAKLNTDEYKIKKTDQQPPNNESTSHSKIHKIQQTPKQKYQKLLEILKKQQQELIEQKEQFKKKKDLMQFKSIIKGQETVPFIKDIQRDLSIKKINKALSRRRNPEQVEQSSKLTTNQIIKSLNENQKQKCLKEKTEQIDLIQMQEKINKLQRNKESLQREILSHHNGLYKQLEPDDESACKKYQINQVHQIPFFTVEGLKQFVTLNNLRVENNNHYKTAQSTFEMGLNQAQRKNKIKPHCIDAHQQSLNNQQEQSIKISFKRRYEGTKRITKYQNGWMQVWTPGQQRVMANKELGYKVIWMKNGDIKQEWKKDNIGSYYCHSKQIIEFSYSNNEPIYFFTKLNQLQQTNNAKTQKTVMFRDERIQTVLLKNDIGCFNN